MVLHGCGSTEKSAALRKSCVRVVNPRVSIKSQCNRRRTSRTVLFMIPSEIMSAALVPMRVLVRSRCSRPRFLASICRQGVEQTKAGKGGGRKSERWWRERQQSAGPERCRRRQHAA
eukprot:364775-Chlamydomonas_euryale.AAC.10